MLAPIRAGRPSISNGSLSRSPPIGVYPIV
jgi:hypothetical protein